MGRVIFGLIVLGLGYWAWTSSRPHFDKAEITRVEDSIRSEYAKRGDVRVDDVAMLAKTPTELTGYAKIHFNELKVDRVLECSAVMSADTGKYFWQCK